MAVNDLVARYPLAVALMEFDLQSAGRYLDGYAVEASGNFLLRFDLLVEQVEDRGERVVNLSIMTAESYINK